MPAAAMAKTFMYAYVIHGPASAMQPARGDVLFLTCRPPTGQQLYLGAALLSVAASADGIFKRGPDRGTLVKAGERIGVVADLDGTILSVIVAPCDAVVHEMMPRRVVVRGDVVYHLATIAGPVR